MASSFSSKTHSFSVAAHRQFIALAGLNLLVYGLLWYFYTTPVLFEPRLNRELLVWPVVIILLYGYWAGYRLLVNQAIPLRWIIISGLLMGLIAICVPPFHSTDVFGYINRGWQQLHYGMDPYVYTVDSIPNWEADPMITDHWVNNPSPYGFLYLLIAKGLCWLGGGQKTLTLLWFKLGNLVVYALTAGLIWLSLQTQTQKNVQFPAENRLAEKALYLYLWNPLVLVHSLANGHNDMWMGLFVTLAAYLALLGSWLWILPALMAAILIKYGTLVILPLAVLFLAKRKQWIALGGGLLLAGLLFGLTGWPYLPDWQHFHLKEINRNAFVSHGSLHSVGHSLFKTLSKEVFPVWYPYRETVRELLKNSLLLLYVAFYGGLAWRRFRQVRYTETDWIGDALLVMVVLIGLVSLKFYPWYLGMFFPLALLMPEGHWLRRFVIVLSGAQLVSITLIGQAHILNFIVMTAVPIGWLIWQEYKRRNLKSTPNPAEPLL